MITTETGPATNPDLRNAWTQLVSGRAEATPFHQLAFIERSAASLGGAVSLVLVHRGGDVVAGAALAVRKRIGILSDVFVPPYAPYSAVLLPSKVEDDSEGAAAVLLGAAVPPRGMARIFLTPEQTIASGSRWSCGELKTFHIDVPSPEGYADNISDRWSTNPKRILRRYADHYDIEFGGTDSSVPVRLNEASYSRHGRPLPIRPDDLRGLVDTMIKQGAATVFAARNRSTSEIDASIVLLSDKRTAYYWIAGGLPGPAMTVLIADVLRYCRDAGVRTFDFVGANTPSIADFKSRFGPRLVAYQTLWTARPGGLRMILQARRRLKS